MLTRKLLWLALAGAFICAVSTAVAYFVRRSLDATNAKTMLMAEPVLFGTYYVFACVIVRYVFRTQALLELVNYVSSLLIQLARLLIQIGAPTNPNSARI
jgi:hypothetical protein